MKSKTTWDKTVLVGSAAVQITAIGSPPLVAQISDLLTDLPLVERPPAEWVRIRPWAEMAGGRSGVIKIESSRGQLTAVHSSAEVCDALVRMLNLIAATPRDGALHLHAAGVSIDGRAALISTHSEGGKSTLAAACLARGSGYLSDECVAVTDGLTVYGYPKALSLRQGSWPLVPAVVKHRLRHTTTLTSQDGDNANRQAEKVFVPVSRLPAPIVAKASATAIVFPDHRCSQGPPQRVAPVDATVRLLTQLLDASDHPAPLLRVARLAAALPAFVVPTRDLSAAARHVEHLLRDDSAAPAKPRAPVVPIMHGPSHPPGSHAGLGRGDHVESVGLGEGGVLHDRATNEVIGLDAIGWAVWLLLDGDLDADNICELLVRCSGADDVLVADRVHAQVSEFAARGLIAGRPRTLAVRGWHVVAGAAAW